MRILITLSEKTTQALATLMADDTADNKSDYIARLIGEETKRRREPHISHPYTPSPEYPGQCALCGCAKEKH